MGFVRSNHKMEKEGKTNEQKGTSHSKELVNDIFLKKRRKEIAPKITKYDNDLVKKSKTCWQRLTQVDCGIYKK